VTRKRLDLELVRRGLVATRREAEELVRAGRVIVAGRPASKTQTLVAPSEPLAVEGEGGAYVSRGGDKISAALDRFGVDPSGRLCLDAGSSTGGFIDVLLARGATRVVAVDVGYGQLAWKLRTDDRVVVMERRNIRDIRLHDLPYAPDLLTADLSFLALAGVVPGLVGLAARAADLILLVKPQFEAGRDQVEHGGVVRDPGVWRSTLESVAESSRRAGAAPLSAMASPLLGPAGNVEFFLHARVGAEPATADLDAAVREGEALRPVQGGAS
jgi:23S rRNA (cytidine1920-2'-O)/16S rRNA (cytidine1409-2'-O)-methyltransferase